MNGTGDIGGQTSGKHWHFDVSGVAPAKAKPDETANAAAEMRPDGLADNVSDSEGKTNHDTGRIDDKANREEVAASASREVKKKAARRRRQLSGKVLLKYVPWMMMVVACLLLLIYNRYRIEDLVKEKNETQERIKYLREHKIQMQKKYQESTKISKIAEELDTLGIGLLSGPPYEIAE